MPPLTHHRRCALLAALSCFRLGAPAPIPFDGVIRPSADGSSYAFLPPPSGGNHAATIESLPDGTLAVAWFTGGEGQPNCSIALSLLPPNGTSWSPGRVVSRRTNYSNQNPVLYYDDVAAALYLYHTSQATGSGGGEETSQIWRTASLDGGLSWQPAAPFFTLPGAFTRNRIIPLRTGGLLFPCYNSSPGTLQDYSFMLRSDAARATWSQISMPQSFDLIQPSVVRVQDFLRAWLRDEHSVAIYYSDSLDEGLTWTLPARSWLPNDNAGIEALLLRDGTLAMVYDNVTGDGLPRSPLAISLSTDGGFSWPRALSRILQAADDNSTAVGEYSYPSLLQSADGAIHVVYTYDHLTIKYMRFPQSWVAG